VDPPTLSGAWAGSRARAELEGLFRHADGTGLRGWRAPRWTCSPTCQRCCASASSKWPGALKWRTVCCQQRHFPSPLSGDGAGAWNRAAGPLWGASRQQRPDSSLCNPIPRSDRCCSITMRYRPGRPFSVSTPKQGFAMPSRRGRPFVWWSCWLGVWAGALFCRGGGPGACGERAERRTVFSAACLREAGNQGRSPGPDPGRSLQAAGATAVGARTQEALSGSACGLAGAAGRAACSRTPEERSPIRLEQRPVASGRAGCWSAVGLFGLTGQVSCAARTFPEPGRAGLGWLPQATPGRACSLLLQSAAKPRYARGGTEWFRRGWPFSACSIPRPQLVALRLEQSFTRLAERAQTDRQRSVFCGCRVSPNAIRSAPCDWLTQISASGPLCSEGGTTKRFLKVPLALNGDRIEFDFVVDFKPTVPVGPCACCYGRCFFLPTRQLARSGALRTPSQRRGVMRCQQKLN